MGRIPVSDTHDHHRPPAEGREMDMGERNIEMSDRQDRRDLVDGHERAETCGHYHVQECQSHGEPRPERNRGPPQGAENTRSDAPTCRSGAML